MVYRGHRWRTWREWPVIVLRRFKNGRAYVEFENGMRRNVDGSRLAIVP